MLKLKYRFDGKNFKVYNELIKLEIKNNLTKRKID